MEGELRYGQVAEVSQPPNIVKVFEELFPQYLAMGMSYDQYWNQDSSLVKSYRKAFTMTQKWKYQEIDNAAWLNGRYVYDALSVALSALFSKNGTDSSYPEEPYSEKAKRERAKTPEEKKEEFLAYWRANKKKWKEAHGEENN
nr:hypothetical protein [Eubacteriales bacterium]